MFGSDFRMTEIVFGKSILGYKSTKSAFWKKLIDVLFVGVLQNVFFRIHLHFDQ